MFVTVSRATEVGTTFCLHTVFCILIVLPSFSCTRIGNTQMFVAVSRATEFFLHSYRSDMPLLAHSS